MEMSLGKRQYKRHQNQLHYSVEVPTCTWTMHIAMIAHSALLVFLGLSMSCQYASANPSLTVENSDGACHCNFSLALNIPPCVCNGVAEVVEENKRLKSEIKGLVEASCFGENQSKDINSELLHLHVCVYAVHRLQREYLSMGTNLAAYKSV